MKIRLGYENSDLALENALAAESAGAHWLTVHARTKVDGYKPPAHWEQLAPLRERLRIPLIANGDLWSVEDAQRCLEVSGCSDLMLGRGAVADPYLALRLVDAEVGRSWSAVLPHVQRLARRSRDLVSADFAVARSKQWTRLLARNFSEAEEVFQAIKRERCFEAVFSRLS